MLKSKQMSDGTIHASEDADEFHRVRPIHAPAAERGWNGHIQQSAGAQQVPLIFCRAASLVAFDSGLSKYPGQLLGDFESVLPRRCTDAAYAVIQRRKHNGPPV